MCKKKNTSTENKTKTCFFVHNNVESRLTRRTGPFIIMSQSRTVFFFSLLNLIFFFLFSFVNWFVSTLSTLFSFVSSHEHGRHGLYKRASASCARVVRSMRTINHMALNPPPVVWGCLCHPRQSIFFFFS